MGFICGWEHEIPDFGQRALGGAAWKTINVDAARRRVLRFYIYIYIWMDGAPQRAPKKTRWRRDNSTSRGRYTRKTTQQRTGTKIERKRKRQRQTGELGEFAGLGAFMYFDTRQNAQKLRRNTQKNGIKAKRRWTPSWQLFFSRLFWQTNTTKTKKIYIYTENPNVWNLNRKRNWNWFSPAWMRHMEKRKIEKWKRAVCSFPISHMIAAPPPTY